MRETIFKTIGVLPASDEPWHVREGGGHIYFVNEDPAKPFYGLVDGAFVEVVDGVERTDAPLIMPKVDA